MPGQLLLIKLPYTIAALRDEIAKLVALLPDGSAPVIYTDTLVGIAMPHCGIPEIKAKKVREVMKSFQSCWVIGMNDQFFASDGSVDPFRTWVDKYRRGEVVRQRGETEYMPFAERREPRPESPK